MISDGRLMLFRCSSFSIGPCEFGVFDYLRVSLMYIQAGAKQTPSLSFVYMTYYILYKSILSLRRTRMLLRVFVGRMVVDTLCFRKGLLTFSATPST